jgi:hypothetical protein
MDQDILVDSGRHLVDLLIANNLKPRVAMFVRNPDTGSTRLWLMPPPKLTGPKHQNEIFRKLAELISKNRDKISSLEVSDIDLIAEDHPAILGMRGAFKVTGRSLIQVRQSTFNGFFLPEATILEMDI